MTRNLMTEAGVPHAASADMPNARVIEPSAAPGAKPGPQPLGEALAGAFPDWDLLPATPFLRRVR